MKDIAALTATQLTHAIAKADAGHFALCDQMIAAGRGHERPTETRGKADPLSVLFNASLDHCGALSAERERRLAWHGTLKPIKR